MKLKLNGKIISIILACTLTFMGIYLGKEYNSKSSIDELNNRTNNDTFVAIGIFDQNGKIIDNGTRLNINESDKLYHTIDMNQELEESREYLLITMVDFKQVPFRINGKSYSTYYFELEKSDKINFNIEVDVNDQNKELDYIIIKNPNKVPTKQNFEEMIDLQHIITSRFYLNSNDSDLVYEEDIESSFDGLFDNIWISNNKEELNYVYEKNEEEITYLSIGNDLDKNTDYAVVLFNDWNQISLDNQLVKYFNIRPGEKQIFKLELPSVKKDTCFQAIVFPMAYNVNTTDVISQTSFGTLKLMIKNVK